ncbi:MAG: hypothetical protein K0R63_1420 [Rickettsiales bacterium]|jgi:tetratricopeptide (TPR) repeat protein|nr:hypothetical protein [Rickettsiales bacterium]
MKARLQQKLQQNQQQRTEEIRRLLLKHGISDPDDFRIKFSEYGNSNQWEAYEELIECGKYFLPNDPITYYHEGIILLHQKKYQQALKQFLPLANTLQFGDLYKNIAIAFDHLGNPKQAIVNYQKALEIYEKTPEYTAAKEEMHSKLSDTYFRMNDLDSTATYAEKIPVDRRTPELVTKLMCAYVSKNRPVDAANLFLQIKDTEAFTLIPLRDTVIPKIIKSAAGQYRLEGKYDKALHLLQQLPRYFPDKQNDSLITQAEIWNYKGYKAFKRQHYDEATEAFEEANRLHPRPCLNILHNLIAAYYNTANFSRAWECYEAIISAGNLSAGILVYTDRFPSLTSSFQSFQDKGKDLLPEDSLTVVSLTAEQFNGFFTDFLPSSAKTTPLVASLTNLDEYFLAPSADGLDFLRVATTPTPTAPPPSKPHLFNKNGKEYTEGNFRKMWGHFISEKKSRVVGLLAEEPATDELTKTALKDAFDSGRICLAKKQAGMKYIGDHKIGETTYNWEIKIRESKSRIYGRTLPEKQHYIDEKGKDSWVTVVEFSRYSDRGLHKG